MTLGSLYWHIACLEPNGLFVNEPQIRSPQKEVQEAENLKQTRNVIIRYSQKGVKKLTNAIFRPEKSDTLTEH